MYQLLTYCIAIVACCIFGYSHLSAQAYSQEAHHQIAMRLIGHRILLESGDSTSRVLAVERIGERYKISFDADIELVPERWIPTVERVMRDHQISNSYIVEIMTCESSEVVYGYEIAAAISSSMIPCGGRVYPKDCYTVFVTLIAEATPIAALETIAPTTQSSWQLFSYGLGGLLFVGLSLMVFRKKSTSDSVVHSPHLEMGSYQFDAKNNLLIHKKQTEELTHKEAQLLLTFFAAANSVLTREILLEKVWGDEGDYVGRTLDVFISKLRKKLRADDSLKIVNVRGVGYRMVVKD